MLAEADFTINLTIDALEARIQSRSGYRLRGLRIELIGDCFRIAATAPSFHVRQLAERAALELLPAEQLNLAVDVASRATSFSAW